MTATRSAARRCPLCGNPTPTDALVETHVGPTNRYPHADVVVWLCVACAVEVTAFAAGDAKCDGGRR